MILYPAIDLKDGKCVRLYKGRMEQETVFNGSISKIKAKLLSYVS